MLIGFPPTMLFELTEYYSNLEEMDTAVPTGRYDQLL